MADPITLPPLPEPDAPEPTDAEGPRGTYGCACADRDSLQCAAIRYGMDHCGEVCGCLCHQWNGEDVQYH